MSRGSRAGGLDLEAIEAQHVPANGKGIVAQLIREIRALRTALRPRQAFFEKCWEWARDAREVEGSDVQDWAYELGLLVKMVANAPCGEGCVCEEIADDFPTDCYRPAPIPDVVGAPERDL